MNITFLVIIIILGFFYYFTKESFRNISRFSPIDTVPGIFKNTKNENFEQSNILNVYPLDTRYTYPYSAPVNPMGTKSVLINNIQASSDLFYNQTMSSKNALINSNPNESTNELSYSGGSAQLLSIPLQYNIPNEPEILRSQPILITPYNRIKYSTNQVVKNDVYL